MDYRILTLKPTQEEAAPAPAAPAPANLEDAVQAQMLAVMAVTECRNRTAVARAAIVAEEPSTVGGRLAATFRSKKSKAERELKAKEAATELQAAVAAEHAATEAMQAAQVHVRRLAHEHYDALIRDKRVGYGVVACSTFRPDIPTDEQPNPAPRCHCNEVPGNTWGDDFVPHTAENANGKPWCPACQSWTCGGPHPMVPLEVFLARFELAAQ